MGLSKLSAAALAAGAAKGNFGAGAVLQTVGGSNQATVTTNGAITSSAVFVSTGISLSITPQSTSNKVRVTVSVPVQLVPLSSQTSTYGALALYRNGANVLTGGSPAVMAMLQNPTSNGNSTTTLSFTWIDSPASIAATTYALYFLTTGSTFQICPQVQNMGVGSGYTFMVEEIAG